MLKNCEKFGNLITFLNNSCIKYLESNTFFAMHFINNKVMFVLLKANKCQIV